MTTKLADIDRYLEPGALGSRAIWLAWSDHAYAKIMLDRDAYVDLHRGRGDDYQVNPDLAALADAVCTKTIARMRADGHTEDVYYGAGDHYVPLIVASSQVHTAVEALTRAELHGDLSGLSTLAGR